MESLSHFCKTHSERGHTKGLKISSLSLKTLKTSSFTDLEFRLINGSPFLKLTLDFLKIIKTTLIVLPGSVRFCLHKGKVISMFLVKESHVSLECRSSRKEN